MHLAAENEHADAIKALTRAGADVLTKNHFGETPMMLARREKCNKAIKALQEAGVTE